MEKKTCRDCKYNDDDFCLRFPPQFCNFHSDAQFPMITNSGDGKYYRACGEYTKNRKELK